MARTVIASALLVTVLAAVPGALARPAARSKPATKVTVLEYEYGFKLSRLTVPAGRVTFLMGNAGGLVHNFDVIGVREGPFLVPGQSATMTVTMKRGVYTYVCSVKYHASQGMQGTITVK
jgi:plastocyanin